MKQTRHETTGYVYDGMKMVHSQIYLHNVTYKTYNFMPFHFITDSIRAADVATAVCVCVYIFVLNVSVSPECSDLCRQPGFLPDNISGRHNKKTPSSGCQIHTSPASILHRIAYALSKLPQI